MSHIKLPIVITPTRVELGLRCHRRHVLSDILSRASYYSPSLEFGSVIHAGAGAHWLGTKFQNQKPWRQAIEEEWQKRFVEKDISQESVSLQMANAMMEHYEVNAQLAGPFTEEGGYKLVDVEQRFEVPFQLSSGESALISFQCDRIVHNSEKDHYVIPDTKTAQRLDARWERQWEMSLQMKLYKALIKQVLGASNVDIVIEGVLKHIPSDIRYYVCPDWSDLQLGEALYAARAVADQDEAILKEGYSHSIMDPSERYQVVRSKEAVEEMACRYTLPNYGDCFAYNVECPFRRICSADVPERVGILRGEYFELPEEKETY